MQQSDIARLPLSARGTLSVTLVNEESDVLACQQLRYQVFSDEMGAHIDTDIPGLDRDRFDRYCLHLVVRDERCGQVVGTTRLLTTDGAGKAGLYYSETQFDITAIRSLPGRFMEIGRTCIHPDYRRGATLPLLWQGIARLMVEYDLDYLIGCASIPLDSGAGYVHSVISHLRKNHLSPPELRARPYVPLPMADKRAAEEVLLPPLLKGYLRQGAWICGEPYFDAAFNVADVFVLLKREQLARRYVKHFIDRANFGQSGVTVACV